MIGYDLDYRLRFSSARGFFSLLRHSGPTNLHPTHCVQRELSPDIKRQEHKPDHSFLPRSDVKNSWSFISIPRWTIHGVVLSYGGDGLCLIRELDWWKNSSIIHRPILIKKKKVLENFYLFGYPSGRLFLHRLLLLYEAVSKVPFIQR